MYTRQELFDKVVKHLLTQKEKAFEVIDHGDGSSETRCLYRAKDGKKCAAGCLIKDEVYDPSIEGYGLGIQMVDCALIASGVSREDLNLVHTLQILHDSIPPERWLEGLRKIADEDVFGLTFPEIEVKSGI